MDGEKVKQASHSFLLYERTQVKRLEVKYSWNLLNLFKILK